MKLRYLLLLGGILFSVFSAINVSQGNVPEPDREVYSVSGANIYCDKRSGALRSICTGEYSRGWPIAFIYGNISASETSQVNNKVSYDIPALILNTAIWSSIFIGLLLWRR